MFSRLRELGARPPPARVLSALRQAYLTAFGLLGVPGLLLGLAFGRRATLDLPALLALLGLAALFAGTVFWLASRGRQEESTPLAGAVRASIQLASAPAVPFLMGCGLTSQPGALAGFWGLALALLAAGWRSLRP